MLLVKGPGGARGLLAGRALLVLSNRENPQRIFDHWVGG